MIALKPVYFDYSASLETGFGWRREAVAGEYAAVARYGRQMYRDFLADQQSSHSTCGFWQQDDWVGLVVCQLPTDFKDHIRRPVLADVLLIFEAIQRPGVQQLFQSLINPPWELHGGLVDWMGDVLRQQTTALPTWRVSPAAIPTVKTPLGRRSWLVHSDQVARFSQWFATFGDAVQLAVATEVLGETRLKALVAQYQPDGRSATPLMGLLASHSKVFERQGQSAVDLHRLSGLFGLHWPSFR